MELGLNPALERLKNSRSVLLAGAGGGFDVFAGLPILFWLASSLDPSLKPADEPRLRSPHHDPKGSR